MPSDVSPVNIHRNEPSLLRALQAISLTFAVVVFNLLLYIAIFILGSLGIVNEESVFPPLVLFLSFALSVGIILIIGLGERIDTKNVNNTWVKAIGVGPIMVVVAVLLSVLASFAGLGKTIVGEKPKFMLANVGVSCSAADLDHTPEARQLLTFISSEQDAYIRDVKDFLGNESKMRHAMNPHLKFVTPGDDDVYKELFQYAHETSGSLLEELGREDRWVAYTIDARSPELSAWVPVPSEFQLSHKTRLFMVTSQLPTTSQQPEVDALNAFAKPAPYAQKRVIPLFQVEIAPKWPPDRQWTNLDVKVFPGHNCWHSVIHS